MDSGVMTSIEGGEQMEIQGEIDSGIGGDQAGDQAGNQAGDQAGDQAGEIPPDDPIPNHLALYLYNSDLHSWTPHCPALQFSPDIEMTKGLVIKEVTKDISFLYYFDPTKPSPKKLQILNLDTCKIEEYRNSSVDPIHHQNFTVAESHILLEIMSDPSTENRFLHLNPATTINHVPNADQVVNQHWMQARLNPGQIRLRLD